jgi:quinoprotein glucose dehydrogenase
MLTTQFRPSRRTLVSRIRDLVFAFVFVGLFSGTPAEGRPAQQGRPEHEWRYYGSDKAFTRYSALDQIDRDNVERLEIAWRRPAVDAALIRAFPDLTVSSYLRSTPVMIEGVLYAPNGVGLIEAFDPGTGATLWRQRPFEPTLEFVSGRSNRGLDSWSEGSGRRLFAVREPYLYALDAETGEYIPDFGAGGRAYLTAPSPEAEGFRWSSGPIVVGDVVVVAGIIGGAGDSGVAKEAAPEDVRGFDARTGRLLWTFHVVPRPGEPGNDTWGEGAWEWSGDLGSWCCLSADEGLGSVYVPLSSPTAAYYGGHRPGWNLYANSLVALDARTGELRWHFQMVHHDVWEYDTVGPPILGDIVVDGRRIRAVMQPSKTGFLYVFDRVTGQPVWPIEERPVPQSTVPGEVTSATQPFPTKPPPFGAQGVTEDDLIDFTPELRARALELVEPFVLGPIFTPPTLRSDERGGKRGTLARPGVWGSGNWNTGAFDPETGMYYAVSHMLPDVYSIARTSDQEGARVPFAGEWPDGPAVPDIDGLPIFKPPYGRITAIDLSRGEHAWVVANGNGPRDHPLLEGLDLPPLGVAGRAAPLLTKTLLFIGEGGDAVIGTGDDGWGRHFRAYDKATGAVVWTTELDAGTTAAPMTYLHDGIQYIVVAIGGEDHPAGWVALRLR